jgi:glycosyltransferase involved in cell wall biosynthesis
LSNGPTATFPLARGGSCVLEPDPSGHRLDYVRHLIAAAEGRCILLTSAEATSSEEYAAHAALLAPSTVVLPDADDPGTLLPHAVEWARAAGARRLVLPDGDKYLVALLALLTRHPRLPLEIRLLLLRTSAIRGSPERLRPATVLKPVLTQLLRPFRQVKILFLTDALGVVARRSGYPGLVPVKDPVDRSATQRSHVPEWFPPRGPDTTFVGLFGVISARKNLPLLVNAVSRVAGVVLIVAGRLDPDVREFTDTDPCARSLIEGRQMVLVDRRLRAGELEAALASVDLVAVLHDNDSPSGILAEACVRGTPVLVPVGGWLAQVVDTSDVGASTSLTAHAVAEGIQRVHRDRDRHVEAARSQARSIGTNDFTDKLLRT